MIEHAAQFTAAKSPSCSIPARVCHFGPEDLKRFIAQAALDRRHDYEWGYWQQKTGFAVSDVTARSSLGGHSRCGRLDDSYQGADVGGALCEAEAVIDPTGCGDAFALV